jgi:hypothetical protein
VPAGATITLAMGDRPQVRLKDLPVNQDGCKGAVFGFTYSGTAHN